MPTWVPYPDFVNPGDNAWQLTAATLVGLMSVPGLVVLYGGVMQKRWSVNSMMMAFVAFALVLIVWVLSASRWPSAARCTSSGPTAGSSAQHVGNAARRSWERGAEQTQAVIPSITTGPAFNFPPADLVYFQFVFAAITPILMLGSVLGRINFKAWIPFVILWSSLIYTVNAFLIWGGGWWAQHGAVDYSGGYVIHLAAGVSGFVAAAVIGPRLQRDREVDAPEQPADGRHRRGPALARLERLQRRRPVLRGRQRRRRPCSTRTCAGGRVPVWVASTTSPASKPSLISSVNGMITGLVAITPARRLRQRLGRDRRSGSSAERSSTSRSTTSAACGRSGTSTTPSAWSTRTASPGSPAACWSGSSPTRT